MTAEGSAKRRNILFLIPSLKGGGAERVMVTLLKYLSRDKFILTLAVIDVSGAVFLGELPDDVELIDLGCHRVRNAIFKIFKLIWSRDWDVVFSTLGHLNLALAILKPFLPKRIRYIARETTLLSHDNCSYAHPWIWTLLYRLFYRRVDLLICQSQSMKVDITKYFLFPTSKTIVIHNPLDIDLIRCRMLDPDSAHIIKKKEDTYLVTAGRLSPEKGLDLLLKAIAILNNPLIYLDILGDGPLLFELSEIVLQSGLSRQVRFLGFKSNPCAYFARADCFVLPSRYEGLPNAMLEALACGTPVIATPSPGGVQEILTNIDGCLIAGEVSAPAIAEALEKWMSGSRQRIAGNAVDCFSLQSIMQQYEKVLL